MKLTGSYESWKLINRKVQVKLKLGLLLQIYIYRKRESKSL